MLPEHSSSGITLTLRVAPRRAIAGKTEVNLPRLQFYFLQGEVIGVERGEYVGEAVVDTGTQAVDVPGYEFQWVGRMFCIGAKIRKKSESGIL